MAESSSDILVPMDPTEFEAYKRWKDGWYSDELVVEVKVIAGQDGEVTEGRIIRQSEEHAAFYAVEKLGGGVTSADSFHGALELLLSRVRLIAER